MLTYVIHEHMVAYVISTVLFFADSLFICSLLLYSDFFLGNTIMLSHIFPMPSTHISWSILLLECMWYIGVIN